MRHARASRRIEVGPIPGDDRAPAPLPVRIEFGETLELLDRGDGLRKLATHNVQDLDLACRYSVASGPGPTRGIADSAGVDSKAVVALETLGRTFHTLTRRVDDVAGRAVVLDEILLLRVVFLREAADEAHRCALPRVDVLIVVADGEQVQSRIVFGQRLSGERRDEFVLRLADVLVLVDQNPVEAPEHLLPTDECRRLVAPKKLGGVPQDLAECFVARIGGGFCEGNSEDSHGERVARQDVDAARISSNQPVETPPRLHRRVTIVGERQYASRVLAAHTDEVGDAVH